MRPKLEVIMTTCAKKSKIINQICRFATSLLLIHLHLRKKGKLSSSWWINYHSCGSESKPLLGADRIAQAADGLGTARCGSGGPPHQGLGAIHPGGGVACVETGGEGNQPGNPRGRAADQSIDAGKLVPVWGGGAISRLDRRDICFGCCLMLAISTWARGKK